MCFSRKREKEHVLTNISVDIWFFGNSKMSPTMKTFGRRKKSARWKAWKSAIYIQIGNPSDFHLDRFRLVFCCCLPEIEITWIFFSFDCCLCVHFWGGERSLRICVSFLLLSHCCPVFFYQSIIASQRANITVFYTNPRLTCFMALYVFEQFIREIHLIHEDKIM